MEVTLSPDEGGTVVEVVYRDLPTDETARRAARLEHFLERVVLLGGGQNPDPDLWLPAWYRRGARGATKWIRWARFVATD
jgi:hypothetical protein